MIEVIFLGVGGAMAIDPADNHTALGVRRAGLLLLLDCGPTIMRQLEQAGLSAAEPSHVFVSHQHGDHSLGLPMLLLNRVLFWPERPLWVLAAAPVLAAVQQLVDLTYPDLADRLTGSVRFVALDPAEEHELPGAPGDRLSLAPSRHSVPTWGVRVTLAGGRSVVYSSDTAPAASITALAAGADLLAHDTYLLESSAHPDSGHSSAEAVGQVAAHAGVRILALLHRQDTSPAAAARYCAAAAKHFAGQIVAPQAGDRLNL